MRRGFGWGAAILVILLLVGVGIGAYNWGLNEGLEQSGNVEVVRYVGGHGFFPFFPFFLFIPLLFLAIFAFKGAMWRRHWNDHGEGGHGPGMHGRWEQGFEDWHRKQHEVTEGGSSGAGGEPAQPV
jgi:hypothetical protein